VKSAFPDHFYISLKYRDIYDDITRFSNKILIYLLIFFPVIWIHMNIRNEKIRLLLNEVQTGYRELQSEKELKVKLWESNSNEILIPIKIWE